MLENSEDDSLRHVGVRGVHFWLHEIINSSCLHAPTDRLPSAHKKLLLGMTKGLQLSFESLHVLHVLGAPAILPNAQSCSCRVLCYLELAEDLLASSIHLVN